MIKLTILKMMKQYQQYVTYVIADVRTTDLVKHVQMLFV